MSIIAYGAQGCGKTFNNEISMDDMINYKCYPNVTPNNPTICGGNFGVTFKGIFNGRGLK